MTGTFNHFARRKCSIFAYLFISTSSKRAPHFSENDAEHLRSLCVEKFPINHSSGVMSLHKEDEHLSNLGKPIEAVLKVSSSCSATVSQQSQKQFFSER